MILLEIYEKKDESSYSLPMAFKIFSLSYLLSEKLRDGLYSLSSASLCFRPIAKTTMPIPDVEWSLYQAAPVPSMPGGSLPNKQITKEHFSGIQKKCGLFTQNVEILRISWGYWGSPLRPERLLLSGKISPPLESWDTLIWSSY